MSDQGPRGGQRPGAGKRPAPRPPGGGSAPAPQRGRNGGVLEGITGGDQQTTIGLALIAFAVVLGLIFLLKGFNDDDGLVAVDAPTTTSTTVPEVDRDAPPVVDTAPEDTQTELREPEDVAVLVANGSGVTGAASRTADQLRTEGYDVINTANALSQVTETEIHHAEGFEAEAEALAEVMGIDDPNLVELAEPGPVADAEGAQIVVVLGPDIAAAATSDGSSGGTSGTTGSGTSGSGSGGTSGSGTSGGGTGTGTGGSSSGTGGDGTGGSGTGGSSSGGSSSGGGTG